MLDFLEKQRDDVLKELTRLYEQRRNAGVESVGGIINRMDNLKEELERLNKEITELGITDKTELPITSPKKSNSPDTIKAKITELVADGEIEEAIDLIQKIWDKTDLILLSARFNQLKKGKNNGIISQSDYNIESNRITQSLLETLKKL